jgi:hypothetical protein
VTPVTDAPLGSPLLVSAGADTPEVVSMSKDNGSEPRRRMSWLTVASLLVAVARLLLDVWRRD